MDSEFSNFCAAELGEMATDIQCVPHVASQRTNVSPATTVDPQPQFWPFVMKHFDSIDGHLSWCQHGCNSLTGEVIRPPTIHMERGECGRLLQDLTCK